MKHHVIFSWIYACKFIQVVQIRIYLKLDELIIIIVQRNINYGIVVLNTFTLKTFSRVKKITFSVCYEFLLPRYFN